MQAHRGRGMSLTKLVPQSAGYVVTISCYLLHYLMVKYEFHVRIFKFSEILESNEHFSI